MKRFTRGTAFRPHSLIRRGIFAATLAGCFVAGAAAVEPGGINFGRDILPILSHNCFGCHGPDEGARKAKLRLDTREGIFRERNGLTVVVPGKPADSELVARITSKDEEEVMPPPDANKHLTAAQKELLQRWVADGAPWGKFWAFEAPARAAVPDVADPQHAMRNPIDHFIRARLAAEGLDPSPEADRRTLMRRLSLDLLGLPPNPKDVQGFVDDRRPDAYERLLEMMLASPHFGERWGRHWLDLARYADTGGYLNDTLRPYAYLFRDWVIDSINRDQPFDQFTVEQLAGDLLTNPTLEQKIATGFHRNTLKNDEAGSDLELDRVKASVDRAATTGTVWLGLTVGCAECHTHKYDPITHREFYQLYAFFNRTAEQDIPAPRPDELVDYNAKVAAWDAERSKLDSPLEEYVASIRATKLPEWERTVKLPAARWTVIEPAEVTAVTEDAERTIPAEKDHSVSPGPKDPLKTKFLIKAELAMRGVTGFRLEAIADPGKNVGNSRRGDFGLAEFSVLAKAPGGEQRKVKLVAARADFGADGGVAAMAIDGDNTTNWSVAPQTNQSHVIVFEAEKPQDFVPGSTIYFELEHRTVGLINRFRVAVTTAPSPIEPTTTPDAIVATLDTPVEKRSGAQVTELARYFATTVDETGKGLFTPLQSHLARKPAFPKTTAAVLTAAERKTHIHVRGDYQQPSAEVQPGVLEVLHPFKPRGEKPDRLDLARWLVDPANPLTARVTVNHFWKNLFGRGLVSTMENFGAQGERPSHPELLDYLATEFIRRGWSRKEMIRLIVTSATYRQSSALRPDLAERDPYNVLLARQGRHRLEAEVVRDLFLAHSGLLNRKIGGPGIYPPLPAFITAFGRNTTWPVTTGPEQYRRGMYIHLRRNVIYPMLLTFDASDTSVTCAQRERSNSPLQALTLLNDPVFFECSERLGQGLATQEGDVGQVLSRGFEECMSRPPKPSELQAMQSLYADQLKLTEGDTRKALVAVARVIMNLDEFITRE